MSIKKINNKIKSQLRKEEKNKIIGINNNIATYKKRHKDLSYLKTYTIDDIDSLEIDDAISLEKIGNHYKLWIHIACPAAHIEYNSDVDKRARKLISTVYLSNTNIYMFPELLIQDVFSLRNNEIRTALSLGVLLDNDGIVFDYELVQSLIKPNYKLSYEDADELIDYAPNEELDLSIISQLLDKRKRVRKKLGAKEILEPYGKVIVKNNIPTIKVIEPTLARLLISEAMILYGDLMSNITKNNNIPVPYRVQESLDVNDNDLKINSKNDIHYNFIIKKSMGKTYYSSIPQSHDSLGLKSYLHATSPIRRYSDLLVHYQVTRFLNNKALISKEEIDEHIVHINNLSRQNINKFREDQKIWKNKWFQNNNYKKYKVIFLNWINKYKNICILYFVDYSFSYVCFLRSKVEIEIGEEISIKDVTNNYKEIISLQLIS